MELNKKYTFKTVGYLIMNGEEVDTLDIQLSPGEISEIRDWFKLRDMKWIGYVPLEFRKHSPELYDKLYQELVDMYNESDHTNEDFYRELITRLCPDVEVIKMRAEDFDGHHLDTLKE